MHGWPAAEGLRPVWVRRCVMVVLLHTATYQESYRIAGIFRGAKFSRRLLWLYYSNYSLVEFSRNGSFAKN